MAVYEESMKTTVELFKKFVDIIADLRHPETGCPWDIKQTHSSIRQYLIEESYEVLEAIDANDDDELAKELGDLLLQVVLHAQIAKDRGAFTIDDVVTHVSEKMVLRHPHVFGTTSVKDAEQVLENWEAIKKKERTTETTTPSLLDGVPSSLPALLQAQRLGDKASRVNFDWENKEQVWTKVQEELEELHAAKTPEEIEEELGDLLFTLSQYARHTKISAEDALRTACNKFQKRFRHIETSMGDRLSTASLEELEGEWQKSKKIP